MKISILSICLALTSTPTYAGCSKTVPQRKTGTTIDQEQVMKLNDKDLLEEVERFAVGQSRARQEAWSRLDNYPRKELIDSLLHLQQTMPTDDPRYLKISFVLCFLDYAYNTNRQIILSDLTQKRKKDIPPDLVAELVIRLIRRGDKDLLLSLFEAAHWADGAMADDLSAIFIEQMRTDPDIFLDKLRSEPIQIRRNVYRLIFSETTITKEDIVMIGKYL